MTLPAANQREVQRILDSAARRLLAKQRDADALPTPARSNAGTGDGGSDKPAFLLKRQPLPVLTHADGESRAKAA